MHRKIFISYSSEDRNKLDALSRAFRKSSQKLKPVVVAKVKAPGKPLSDKVKEGISETPYFMPILTRSSVRNQWVNQEIGFAVANHRNIFPLVESSVVSKLKGFIHSQVDLPFTFEGNKRDRRKEAKNFRKCYKELLVHLENELVEPLFRSSIRPKIVKSGESYTTTAHFIGKIRNGFFDNYVVHMESNWRTWNWDPKTLNNARSTTAGELRGQADRMSKYTYSTSGWPIGKYKIYTRVYEHPVPGKTTRYIVAEEEHHLQVV